MNGSHMYADDQQIPAAPDIPLGDLLRALREAANLTQEDLADATGIAVPTISALERGVHRSPQKHTATALAAALGLSGSRRDHFLAVARRGRPSRRTHTLVSAPPPAVRSAILGREGETAAAEKMLERGRLLTITGPGGIGKSRLALAVAQRRVDRGDLDLVAWVPLAEVSDPADMLPAVARAIGAHAASEGDPIRSIAEALTGRMALLILDNLEHLPGAWAAIGAMHDAVPGITILATSRIRLRLAQEQTLTLGPLALPAATGDQDAENPAIALFLNAWEALTPVSAAPLQDIARIVSLLDGVPLAIELAAAQAGTIPPSALAELLEHAGADLLALGRPGPPDRHQRMDATLAWSTDFLPEPARRLFALLGIVRGGFTMEALTGICRALDAPGLIAMLPLLTDAHLVQPDAASARFTMLEPIRLFAVTALQQSGEEAAVRRAHAAWYLDFARRMAEQTAGQHPLPALAALVADFPNIRQAVAAAGESGDHVVALRAAAGLRRFLELRGYIAEGRLMLDAAIRAADAASPAGDAPSALAQSGVLADALFCSGYLAVLQCDFAAGSRAVARLRALAATPGEEAHQIAALGDLLVSSLAGDLPDIAGQAIDMQRAGLARPGIDATSFAGWALTLRLGVELFQQGDPAAALPLLREALTQARLRGVALDQPVALVQLGQAELDLGDLAGARRHLSEAMALAEAFGIDVVVLLAGLGLARAVMLGGDPRQYPEMLHMLDEAETLRARAGYAYGAYWSEQIAEMRRIAAGS